MKYDDRAISGGIPPPPPRPYSATPLSPLHAGHTHQDSLDTPTRLLCSLAKDEFFFNQTNLKKSVN